MAKSDMYCMTCHVFPGERGVLGLSHHGRTWRSVGIKLVQWSDESDLLSLNLVLCGIHAWGASHSLCT